MKNKAIKLSFFAFTAVTLLFSGCNNKENKPVSENTQKPQFVTVKDSVETEIYDGMISMDYPTEGTKDFITSVRGWIKERISANPYEESKKIADMTANQDDAKAVAHYYMMNKIPQDIDKEEMLSMKEMEMKYSCDESIQVTLQGENLTSIINTEEISIGGAHGSYLLYAAVFDNQSGKMYGWDMVKDTNKIKSYILDGLMEYFSVGSKDELMDVLFVEDKSTIPLSQTTPYFFEEGLAIVYNQYEIAPYAAGLPSVTITWDKLQEVLTEEVIAKISSEIKKYSNKK